MEDFGEDMHRQFNPDAKLLGLPIIVVLGALGCMSARTRRRGWKCIDRMYRQNYSRLLKLNIILVRNMTRWASCQRKRSVTGYSHAQGHIALQ